MLNILLQVNIEQAALRQLVRGVSEYARKHGPWRVDLDERPRPEMLRRRKLGEFDGIIFDGSNLPLRKAVRKTGLPAVAVATPKAIKGIPTVVSDHEGIGRMAAEHMLDRGLTEFGYVEMTTGPFAHPRGLAFARELERRGRRCAFFEPPDDWKDIPAALERWLADMPRPVGILAEEDRRALPVISAAGLRGLRVPEEVAVMGINNEELIAELSWPTITSIDHGAGRIGFDAAGLLERLIRGEEIPPLLTVPPVRIVERHSTELMAVDDPYLAEALRLIRRCAADGLNTNEVLDTVPVSRSTLENRFKEVIGRTIHAEITRVRVERVKTLLRTTDLDLAAIASRTGFSYVSHMAKVFRNATAQTPTQFRRQ